MNKNLIRHQTVVLIGKILHPLTESNLIPFPEYREIIAQLKHIAAKGEQLPVVVPKLITMEEAAQMLGISLANFKKQEPFLPFKRICGSWMIRPLTAYKPCCRPGHANTRRHGLRR